MVNEWLCPSCRADDRHLFDPILFEFIRSTVVSTRSRRARAARSEKESTSELPLARSRMAR